MSAQIKKPASGTVRRTSVRPTLSVPATSRYPSHAPLIQPHHTTAIPTQSRPHSVPSSVSTPLQVKKTVFPATRYPAHTPLIQPHHVIQSAAAPARAFEKTDRPTPVVPASPDVSTHVDPEARPSVPNLRPDDALAIEEETSSELAEIEPAIDRENRIVYRVGTIVAIAIVVLSGTFVSVRPLLMNVSTVSPTPTPAPIALPTTAPLPPKSGITLDIYNGTGVAGRAGTMKTTITAAGYTVQTIGNAKKRAATTEIHVSDDIPSAFTDELQTLLGTREAIIPDLEGVGRIQITLGADIK